jgi:hypothetical protein
MATVSGQDVFAELREREARKTNVVMYRIGEAPEERTGHGLDTRDGTGI